MTDPIADMIVRIKNAGEAGGAVVSFPFSQMKMDLAAILKKEGFVKDVTKKGKKITKAIEVELLYDEHKQPRIKGVKRVSRFSKRVYVKAADIKPVKNKFGTLLVSTSRGIMTGKEARESHVGGEALFEIW